MLKVIYKKSPKPFTYEDVIFYRPNKEVVEEVRQKALKILKKSKHFEFFERGFNGENIGEFTAFDFADSIPSADEIDSLFGLTSNLFQVCLFVSACGIFGFQEDSVIFDIEAMRSFETIEFIQKTLAPQDQKKIFHEIKHFLVAYKILCQHKTKLQLGIDVEFWYPDYEINDPLEKWYWYYLPVNIDCQPLTLPKLEDIQGARPKILKYKGNMPYRKTDMLK